MGVCSWTWPGAQPQQNSETLAGWFLPAATFSSQSINFPIHYKVIPASHGTATQHAAHKVQRHLQVNALFKCVYHINVSDYSSSSSVAAHLPNSEKFTTCTSSHCSLFRLIFRPLPPRLSSLFSKFQTRIRQYIIVYSLMPFYQKHGLRVCVCGLGVLREQLVILLGAGWLSRYSYLLRPGRSRDRTRVGVRFSVPFQTGPGAHTPSYVKPSGCLSRGEKWSGSGVDHPPHLAPSLKKE